MATPHQFRHYLIVQDSHGHNVELSRSAKEVAVLAFDTLRLEFVHCHVLLEPLKDRSAFEDRCRRLRGHGHPLMARLVDFGEDEGNPFYITGAVDGEPMSAFLARQTEIPGWLAVMLAVRALEAAAAVCSRGDYLAAQPLDSLRLVQVGPQSLVAVASDYRLAAAAVASTTKMRTLRAGFDKHGKFLRAFLLEQSGGAPTLPDHQLAAADFSELLVACLESAAPSAVTQMRDLRVHLQKLVPEQLAGEIPAHQKPRALISPLLAPYQQVAKVLAGRVRIQSQRLDMTNPYGMRATLAKSGAPVLIEQVPPEQLTGRKPLERCQRVQALGRKSGASHLTPIAMIHEMEGVHVLAEEIPQGIQLSELLRSRGALNSAESYLLLAGVDAALAELDEKGIQCEKLRLEDIFLLFGSMGNAGSHEDWKDIPLTDWGAFSIALRVHPCLSSMAGRGTDPGLLLPPGVTTSANVSTRWHGGWMAALGHFLLGIENPVDSRLSDAEFVDRKKAQFSRLLEDEVARTIDGSPSSRSEFLSRFARVVHHQDLAGEPPILGWKEQIRTSDPSVKKGPSVINEHPPDTFVAEDEEPIGPGAAITAALGGMALTQGLSAPAEEKPSVGFASVLGIGPQLQPLDPDLDGSMRGAPGDSLPGQIDLPEETVPIWLKGAVFLLGSMALGGALAHSSGQALWQKQRPQPSIIQRELDSVPVTPSISQGPLPLPPPGDETEPSPLLPPPSSLREQLRQE